MWYFVVIGLGFIVIAILTEMWVDKRKVKKELGFRGEVVGLILLLEWLCFLLGMFIARIVE